MARPRNDHPAQLCTCDAAAPVAVAEQDADEHIEARTLSIREGLDMVKSGDIKNLKTAHALALLSSASL